MVEIPRSKEIIFTRCELTSSRSPAAKGEYAYNLSLKGFTWDVTNGGSNPTSAALSTGSNWDTATISHKDRAGVAINTL